MKFIESFFQSRDYRPDVDGLRAFAVLAVMLFHAWPGQFGFGIFGVDVFFVISGYLIADSRRIRAPRRQRQGGSVFWGQFFPDGRSRLF